MAITFAGFRRPWEETALAPMALGNAGLIGIPYDTVGIAMIGGLVTSTFLTLFLVPLFYTLLDDLRITAAKLLAPALHRGELG